MSIQQQIKNLLLEVGQEISKDETILPPDAFSKKGEILTRKNQATREKRDYFDHHYKRYLYTLNKIKNIKKGKTLEVGSAFLHLSMVLTKLGHQAFGVDIPVFCQNPQLRRRREKYQIIVKPCDLSCDPIPFPDNYFDNIILTEVLEHLNFSPLNAFIQANRVLKKGGLLIITVPNYNKFENLINFFTQRGMAPNIECLMRQPAMTNFWKEYTLKDLKKILHLTSFKIVRAEYYSLGAKYYLRNRWIDFILNSFLFRIPLKIITLLVPMFKGGIFVVAKKIEDFKLKN